MISEYASRSSVEEILLDSSALLNMSEDSIASLHKLTILFPDLYEKYCSIFPISTMVSFASQSPSNKEKYLSALSTYNVRKILQEYYNNALNDLSLVDDGKWSNWASFLSIIIEKYNFGNELIDFLYTSVHEFGPLNLRVTKDIIASSSLNNIKVYSLVVCYIDFYYNRVSYDESIHCVNESSFLNNQTNKAKMLMGRILLSKTVSEVYFIREEMTLYATPYIKK